MLGTSKKSRRRPVYDRRKTRRHRLEQLEQRLLLASDWQNPSRPLDVNNDGQATAGDALRIINLIAEHGGRLDLGPRTNPLASYVDPSGDGSVSALDALQVVNGLSRAQGELVYMAGAESEGDIAPAGFVSVMFASLPGSDDQIVDLTTSFEFAAEEFNELGFFVVDSVDGMVDGVMPSHSDYAERVFGSARREVIYSKFRNGPSDWVKTFPGGTHLGAYILQTVDDAGNPENHLRTWRDDASQQTATDILRHRIGWEQYASHWPSSQVSNRSFDDVIIDVEISEPYSDGGPPLLDEIADQSIDEGALFNYQAMATDPDLPGDTLTYSLSSTPSGMTISPSSGLIEWQTNEANGPDSYSVTVIVRDSAGNQDTESFTLNVAEVNEPPVLTPIGNQQVVELTELVLDLTATDVDIPAGLLSYSLDAAPTGAIIDSDGGRLTWTPTEVQGPGDYTFTARVSDGSGGFDTETFTVVVSEVNLPPAIEAIDARTVDEGQIVIFTATATDPDTPLNQLRFSLVDAPTSAAIDPSTGAFSWTTTEADGPGEFTFMVKVTDDGEPALSDQTSVTITVNEVNLPPQLDPIADVNAEFGETVSFTATATDPDIPANTLTYSLSTTAPVGATIDANTGEFTWTPMQQHRNGSFDVEVMVRDDGSPALADSEAFTISVGECLFPNDLDGWIASESGGTQTPGTVVGQDCAAVLTEGDSFITTLATSFVVPEDATELSFTYADLNFDTTAPSFINDAFEVALLDQDGNPLVDSYLAGRDAFLNFSEEIGLATGDGVNFDNSTVTVDVAGVLPGETATLIFRLVNNDSDANTSVRIVDFSPWIRTQRVVQNSFITANLATPSGSVAPTRFVGANGSTALAGILESPNPAFDARGPISSASGTGFMFQQATDPGSFAASVEWSQDEFITRPASRQVMSTPAVVDLNDDGIPDVVFKAYATTNGFRGFGTVVRAISGDDGSEIWTAEHPELETASYAGIAVGDIDMDGRPEVIANGQGNLFAFEHDGTFKWKTEGGGIPTIADLDQDGQPEIIGGFAVFDAHGQAIWRKTSGDAIYAVADVDSDGFLDLVSSSAAYSRTGELIYENTSVPSGWPAIGNFDDDVHPEIAVVGSGVIFVLEHDGELKWGPKPIPGGGTGGPPTIADVDGDGEAEIGAAGRARYFVFEANGDLKWSVPTEDFSSSTTGSSVFDFDGNGTAEIVYADEKRLYILRGSDGEALYELEKSSWTSVEYPIVVDVDADGKAEIVVGANSSRPGGGTQEGIYVIGNEDWVGTRQIWNQHSYHITNVNDDGTIPRLELNSWEIYNNYRRNLQPTGTELGPPVISVSAPGSSFPAGTALVLSGVANADGVRANGQPNRIDVVTVNESPVDVLDINGRFFAGIQLLPGQNTYSFTATDTVGQKATTTVTLTGTTPQPGEIDFSRFADITGSFTGVYGRTSFFEDAKTLHVDLATRNDGTFEADVPLLVGVKNISDPTISVVDPDGVMPDGTPYYDYTKAVGGDGILEAGETSASPTVTFHNPTRQQFDYELVFYGKLNEAPVITTVPRIEALAGRDYTYDADATDADGDPLSYSLLVSPLGSDSVMEIDVSTGEITWQPTAEDIGLHDVAVQVNDGRGGIAEQRFTISVIEAPPNRPPVVTSTPITSAHPGDVVGEDEVPVDLRGWTPLTFVGSDGGANGADWDVDESGTFVEQRINGDASYFLSDFDVTEGVISGGFRVADTGSNNGRVDDDFIGFVFGHQNQDQFYLFDWKRNTSAPPGLTARRGMSIKVMDLQTPYRQADFWTSVGNGDRVQVLYNNSIGWKNFTDYRFQLDFVPGSFIIRVWEVDANDESLTLLDEIQLVDDTYQSGGFGFYNYSQSQVQYSSFTRNSVSEQTYRYDVDGLDPDGDAITYRLTANPDGMVINSTTGVLRWAPAADQVGDHNVSVELSDGNGGIAIQNFVVCVHPDGSTEITAPANHNPAITSTPPTTATEGQRFSYPLRAQDADGDDVTYRLENAPAGMAIEAVQTTTNDGEVLGSLTEVVWTPLTSDVGTNPTVTLVAEDGNGGEDRQTIQLLVQAIDAVNRNPEFTLAPRPAARVGLPWSYLAKATDADGDSLTYSMVSGPNGMDITSQGVMQWTPGEALSDSVPVEIRVVDGRGGQAIEEFDLSVTTIQQNSDPSITSIPTTAAVVDESYIYDAVARDLDGDPIFWELASAPRGMSINGLTGEIRWTPDDQQLGNHTVVITATDLFLGESTQRFDVQVGCNNLPPSIVSIPATQAIAGRTYLYAARGDDFENDPLSWQLADAPDGMSIDPDTGVIRWLPTAGQIGSHDVVIEVSDPHQTAAQYYTVVVNSVDASPELANRAPVITSSPVFGGEADSLYSYQVRAVEPDGDEFSFGLGAGAPSEMQISDTGLITWTPAATDVGSHPITVEVTDEFGAISTQSYNLSVTINSPPQISSDPVTSVTSGTRYRYNVRATDPDGDPLSFALTESPEGMTVDRFGRILWDTDTTDTDPQPVSLVVSDDHGQSETQSWAVTMLADQQPPQVSILVITDSGDASVDINRTYSVFVSATDNVGVQNVQLQVDGVVVSLSDRGSAVLTAEQLGDVQLTATATDLSGLVGTEQSTVTVVDPAVTNRPDPNDLQLPPNPGPVSGDRNGPLVGISSPNAGEVVTNQVPIIGTVDDAENNLWYYRVLYSRADRVSLSSIDLSDPDWIVIAQSTQEVIDGELAIFDTAGLANDAYTIALVGFDVNGRGFLDATMVNVEGNVLVGNFQLSLTDLSIPLGGIPIQVTRSYDTLNAPDESDFGYGWQLGTQDPRIFEVAAIAAGGALNGGDGKLIPDRSKVYLTNPDGQRVGFTYRERLQSASLFGAIFTPYFEPDPGVYDTLTIDEKRVGRGGLVGALAAGINPSKYTLTTKEGLQYRYDQTDGLQTITDLNGNVVTFTEEGIEHSNGQSIDFIRDHRNRITQVVDPAGNTIDYGYDLAGDLVSVINQVGLETRYTYRDDPAHFLDEAYDSLGKRVLKAVYEQNAETRQYDFKGVIDAAGNRVDERDFDTAANTGIVRDGNGNATTIVYDDRGNVLTETDPLGNVTIREYSDPRNPDAETRIIDRRGFITDQEFDSRGNVLRIIERGSDGQPIDPLRVTEFTYDHQSRMTSRTNALGAVTKYQYDASGNMVRLTNALGDSSSATYDRQGRITSVTDFNGNQSDYDYTDACPCGLPSRITFADGTYQTYAYNQFGQMTRESTFEADGTLVETQETDYDRSGRVVEERMGLAGDSDHPQTVVRRIYDGHLLDWEIIVHPDSPNETPATPVDQRLSRITDYEYDERDELIRQIDAMGGVVEFRYDENGNRILLQDPVGNVTTWVYDELNRVTEERDPFFNEAFTIDQAIAELTNPSGADLSLDRGANHVRAFAFDAEGNQIEMMDRNGRRREFDYDDAGRLLAERWYSADNNELVEAIQFSYDALGNMLTASNAHSRYMHTYDVLNRLTSVDNNPLEDRDVPRVILSYGYDAQGNPTLTQDDAGVTYDSEYDLRNRLAIRKWYDADVPVDEEPDVDDARVDFFYNAAGRESEVRRYSDLVANVLVGRTIRTYDAAGRSDLLTHVNAVDQLIAGYDYNYDFGGLLLHEARTHQDAQYEQTIDYRYDLTGQLINADFDTQDDESFLYDPNGNRITSSLGSETKNYTTGTANQLTSDGIYRYEYDGEGNQVKRVHLTTGETRILVYDHRNRLVGVDDWSSDPDANSDATQLQSVNYVYDTEGRRLRSDRTQVASEHGDATESLQFTYDMNNIWTQTNEESTTIRYLFGYQIDQVLATIQSNAGAVWHAADRLLSVRDVIDDSSAAVNRNELTAFGSIVSPSDASFSNAFLHTGREWESSTGTYYFRARFLDPHTGRFLSIDPLQFDAGDSNLYRFVSNSPVNATDPTGENAVVGVVVTIGLIPIIYVGSFDGGFSGDDPGDLVCEMERIEHARQIAAFGGDLPPLGDCRLHPSERMYIQAMKRYRARVANRQR